MMRRTSNKYTAVKINQEDEEDLNLGDVALIERKDTAAAAQLSASSVSEEDGLTWTDDFFANRTDVVAVFDFNQEDYARSSNLVVRYISFFQLFLVMFILIQAPLQIGDLVWSWCLVGLTVFKLCYTSRENKKREVWIPHLAVTTTGVRYVEPPEKRFPGSTMLIPFEDIESVEIRAAGGDVVTIWTASTDGAQFVVCGRPRGLLRIQRSQWLGEVAVADGAESNGTRLDIKYLREPYRFKTLVLSLKQQQESSLMPVDKVEAVASAVVEM